MSRFALEIIVIGAGIAGASAAAELARTHRVAMLEGEDSPGYHSTGRSAALFSEAYGDAPVRALARASREFFCAPPMGFSSHPIVKRRGVLQIANALQVAALERFLLQHDIQHQVRRVGADEALSLCPLLRPESAAAGGIYEKDAADIDVHALHHGYLRLFRQRGGALVTRAHVTAVARAGVNWLVKSTAGEFAAPVLINAAGAWADHIAGLAQVKPMGIQPYRRTIALAQVSPAAVPDDCPMIVDMDESYYFRPEAGMLLISPADETPVNPCDAHPEDMDVAIAVDRVEKATRLTIERVRRAWAGLRSFAPDRTPVIGFDALASQFFWLAGQGGYGIQTAPAAAALTVALVRGDSPPPALAGFDSGRLAPSRSFAGSRASSET